MHITGDTDADRLLSQQPLALLIGMLLDLFKAPPAVHRFPGSMAERTQALCAALVDNGGGDAERLWTDGDPDGAIGWRDAAGSYGELGSFRSVADIVDPSSLTKVREFKKAAKAAAKGT